MLCVFETKSHRTNFGGQALLHEGHALISEAVVFLAGQFYPFLFNILPSRPGSLGNLRVWETCNRANPSIIGI